MDDFCSSRTFTGTQKISFLRKISEARKNWESHYGDVVVVVVGWVRRERLSYKPGRQICARNHRPQGRGSLAWQFPRLARRVRLGGLSGQQGFPGVR